MAGDINSVVLVGRVTRDAELRYTSSGTALCNFSIAVNRRAKKGDDWTDEPGFEAVNAARGPHLSVLVKKVWRRTAADMWLKPPEELRAFLRMWAEMC